MYFTNFGPQNWRDPNSNSQRNAVHWHTIITGVTMTSELAVALTMTTELAVVPLASSPGLPSPASVSEAALFSTPDLRKVVWNDIDESPDGEAIGVFGDLWSEMSSKQLRTVASRLSIKGIKNAKKVIIVEKLQNTHRNKKTYSSLQSKQKPIRKEVQCPFRLINLLFSDQFAVQFATLGDVANRQLLDTGRAGNDEHFWVSVRRSFIEPGNVVFDSLAFGDISKK
jgi:hypothetical protein